MKQSINCKATTQKHTYQKQRKKKTQQHTHTHTETDLGLRAVFGGEQEVKFLVCGRARVDGSGSIVAEESGLWESFAKQKIVLL